MRINKWIIIGSIFVCVFGFLGMILPLPYKSIMENIGISLFTGAIVSIVTSTLYYVYERQAILSKIKSLLPELYLYLSGISTITGDIIPKILITTQLSSLKFHWQSNLVEEALKLMNGYQEGSFSGFLPNGKANKKVESFEKYITELRNLKYLLTRLELYAMEADIFYNQLLSKQTRGQYILHQEEQMYKYKRELVTVQSSKIHEYEASLLKQLDEIAQINYDGKNENWAQVKAALNDNVNLIITEAKQNI